ncbi:hypothetical protein BK648_24650 [Pseudomonas poae]|uniref:Methyl-accepting chemotaxis protein n=1 Tax=Pseudomonas poae TaxID=200451 RepID=A0A423ERM3_9PSED|nr:hypothetical protein BK648_24650 [Pseudomonas poae]
MLIILLLVTTGAAYYGISEQQALIEDIHSQRIKQYQEASTGVAYAQLLIRESYSTVQRFIEAGRIDPADLTDIRKELLGMADDLQKQVQSSLHDSGLNPDEVDLYKQLDEQSQALRQSVVELLDGAEADGINSLAGNLSLARSQFNYVDTLYAKLVNMQKDLTEQAFASANSKAALIIKALILLTVLSLLVAISVSLLISRHIAASISRIREGAVNLCGGNLTQRVRVIGRDEIAQTANAFNTLIDSFQTTVREVVHGSDQLASSAYQLNQSANQLADGSKQQADSASSAAITVEQMTASIHSLSQNAQFVKAAAAQSLSNTQAGVSSLGQLRAELMQMQQASASITLSVNDFVRSTASISDMTNQVKALAAQTNLLALNAAIEAARAGDQGRGFAVVAAEVRQLAERSSAAANSIDDVTRALVGQSGAVEKSLAAGAAAMTGSHEQLAHLEQLFASARNSVDEVFQGIESMAGAVEEQSMGSQGITRSIEHISSMADASNQVCRDTFQATQLLRNLADSLQSTTSRFSV